MVFEGGFVDTFRPGVVARIWILPLIDLTKENLNCRR
jgi:hypothetical protein